MSNTTIDNNSYAFKELLDTNNLILYYTQMLNAARLDNHKAVYVFDEVGCGKTISAIMAIAKTIWDKNNNEPGKPFNILVVTPKSVCSQFKAEILDKLRFDEDITDPNNPGNTFRLNTDDVKDISNLGSGELTNKIEEIKDKSESHIIITNPHKMCKLAYLQWDLIVVDEAHDIVCNSKKQTTEFYNRDKIKDSYENLSNKLARLTVDAVKREFTENINELETYEGNELKTFGKLILVLRYNELSLNDKIPIPKEDKISVPENRTDIKLYRSLLCLRATKVMFLSATPYKNSKEPDFLNYAYAATKITKRNGLFHPKKCPNLDWVPHLYKEQIETGDLQQFEKSNTSMLFKEVANSIPFEVTGNNSVSGETDTKHRFISILDPDNLNQLPSYLVSLNTKGTPEGPESSLQNDYTADDKNRVIIFVSCSAEGEEVFNKIFPNSESQDNNFPNKRFDIVSSFSTHTYKDAKTNITCKFVMNKFGNTGCLNQYSKEPMEQDDYTIPDILIVTWQVAQVGVNFPTFNHVIHYSISHLPGDIEQRFGRIDRMTTKMHNLYNIYCFKEGSGGHHTLSEALSHYMATLVNKDCNLPVKNILLCKDLKLPNYNEEKTIAFINFYIDIINKLKFDKLKLNTEISEINKKIDEYPKKCMTKINELNTEKSLQNNQDDSYGMYCDETSDLSEDDLELVNIRDESKDHTVEVAKYFAKTVEDLLEVLTDQTRFNKQIEEINETNYNAGDIIYSRPNDTAESDSTEKAMINLNTTITTITQNISDIRTKRGF